MSWPRRNVTLSQPPASTGLTGRSAQCGNCVPTSRDTSPAVISALRTTGLSQPAEPGSHRFTCHVPGTAGHARLRDGEARADGHVREVGTATSDPDAEK